MRTVWLACVLLFGGASLLTVACAAENTPRDAGLVVTYMDWSPTALYIACRVDDPLVVGNQTLPLSQPWQDDAVAIYLNLNPQVTDTLTNDCVRVVISAAGGATVQRGDHGEWRDDPTWFQSSRYGTIRYVVKVLGKLNDSTSPDQGYQVELGLAWGLLGITPPIRERLSDPLPAIGFTVACYAQGETRSVSCWPPKLTEADLNTPATWGKLQFQQTLRPVATEGTVANASVVMGDALIDGDIVGPEWLSAGIVTLQKRTGEVATPITPGRQAVNLLTAWYSLDPPAMTAVNHPLDPPGTQVSPETPLYHLLQIRGVRRAGFDALAVVLPVGDETQTATARRLGALVRALKDYDHASSALFSFSTPLIMPVLDLSGPSAPDPHTVAGQQAIETALDTFYGLVPPQYLLMVPDATRQLCSPIILTAPSGAGKIDALFTGSISAHLKTRWGVSVGWMLDTPWQRTGSAPDVLTHCAWDPAAGFQVGDGVMATVLIAPGAATLQKDDLPRRNGDVYGNGWSKIGSIRPDFTVVRSWNEFARGTEIAASSQYGYQFIDTTRLETMRLADRRGFGVRLLRHTLPAVLRSGITYPVEVLLKNGSVEKLLGRNGIHVEYRVTQDDRVVFAGTATEQIVLLEFTTARIRFTLPTEIDRRHPLPAGSYQLQLDFRRNKVPFLTGPLLMESLGTLTIPFAIAANGHEQAQVLFSDVPSTLVSGTAVMARVDLRNTGSTTWRKNKLAFRWRWVNPAGQPLAGEETTPCAMDVAPGALVAVIAKLPVAPPQVGSYHARLELLGLLDMPVPTYMATVQVVDADLRAQFLGIDFPGEISAEQESVLVPIAVRNPGQTAWTTETRVTYQWLAWDGQPIPDAAGSAPLPEDVPCGGATTLRLAVTPPPGAGAMRCAFGLEHQGRAAALTGNPLEPVMPVYTAVIRPDQYLTVDLKGAFNDWASHSDTTHAGGRVNLDGEGNAFPTEEFLPDATNPLQGYLPGYQVAVPTTKAVGFRFAAMQDGRAPMVRAKGQTLALPQQPAAALQLVAMSTGAAHPVTFTLRYLDGTKQAVDLSISNWLGDPAHGEPIMWRTRHVHTARGEDWYLQGTLFTYRIPLDPVRKLEALLLPEASEIGLFAVTLERPSGQVPPR